MKFTVAGVLALASLALAMPAPEAAAVAEAEALEVSVPVDISPEALGLEKRARTLCKIVNSSSSKVNCRTGPGFDYPASYSVIPGKNYEFRCYKSGDCYNGNCTWQRINWDGKTCYVNGYYTDSKCTVAALGKC
ncbi:uncharacterized protein BDW70DRAFT_156209 [Aspergillus foveolatus]|uniref:uncharacterized protein n=1 Tax=Aspergillus foveolatus TaxID=210207 RepID=UPI003CCC9BA1